MIKFQSNSHIDDKIDHRNVSLVILDGRADYLCLKHPFSFRTRFLRVAGSAVPTWANQLIATIPGVRLICMLL